MTIRLGMMSDIDALCELYEMFFEHNASEQPEYYRSAHIPKGSLGYDDYPKSVIASESEDILVAVEDGVVIALLHIAEDTTPPYASIVPHRFAIIVDLVVRDDWRSRGIGGLLVDEAKMWAKARDLDYLELFVLDENEGAFQFYQGNGFKTVSKTMR